MLNTLFGRLFISSLLVLGLFFGFIAYIIHQLNLEHTYSTKQEQLRLQNYVLVSSASLGDDNIELPDELREPRFDDFESGLYGFVSSGNKIYWSSYSAHNLELDTQLLKTDFTQSGQNQFVIKSHYFIYHYSVQWELENDEPQLFTFSVLEDSRPTMETLEDFRGSLHRWLVAIGILLITILLLIMRWGTKPLRQLAKNLKQIEKGEKDTVEGHFPKELHRITSNLNQLISTERLQRERYHNTLADLAHSLKTPLAVIQTELESNTDTDKALIAEQTQRMDEIITHQLQRAVLASSHQLIASVDVKTCVDRLTSAMAKVYAEKNIQFSLDLNPNSQFKGDQRDLMEILGNLLDNACKACQQQIKIKTTITANILRIEIHDDGRGIAKEQRQLLVQRGQRADTRHTGQGIGLDVVSDIVDSYQGKLQIEESELGGALISIELPTMVD
ncbi:ATP-binding protein [Oceanicoccus sp. KOV_DT_Chl]|uniref:ATP-binding protein n=1 Tax=Oceanicoccus sp. KOV_DT_Chl TaxID=1904639 RepID=UPI000C7ABA0D|nr:ATP-binding protein [Oceanicoccus sp. KOV_DT_Chl]